MDPQQSIVNKHVKKKYVSIQHVKRSQLSNKNSPCHVEKQTYDVWGPRWLGGTRRPCRGRWTPWIPY